MRDNQRLYCTVFDLEFDRSERPGDFAFFAAIADGELTFETRQRLLPASLQDLEPTDPPGYVELTEQGLMGPGGVPVDVWTVRHFRSWGHEDYWAHYGWLCDLWLCSLDWGRYGHRCLGASLRSGQPFMTYFATPEGLRVDSDTSSDVIMSWPQLDQYLAASG